MSSPRWALLLVLLLCWPVDMAHAEEEEDGGLQQLLTEREDKRRPPEPLSIPVWGRPLFIGGELEVEVGYLRRRVVDESVRQPHQLLLESGIEVEVFYSFGQPLSLFAQFRATVEEDLLSHSFEPTSDLYVERGEMWLYSENIAGTNVNVDVGRLDFEDERRWWWDDELDAVRVEYETETFEIALAVARELFSNRTDRGYVDPERERLLRLIGEVSWDWRPNHSLEFFVLHQADHSPTERPGDVVFLDREDDSDARLTWFGGRMMGAVEHRSLGILGYWIDTGFVWGREQLVEFEDLTRRRSVADAVTRRDVGGWAFDVGLSWILPCALEPRLFAGYARGSGDSAPEERKDRSYRQTGLHGNEAGFGGVERFPSYGVVLDPELSNLSVLTIGVGFSLLRSSSLDLVYHQYRLVDPATSLRDARLEVELTGRHRNLGHGIDLVLALEEWERFELQLVAAGFRAGSAFGDVRGTWSYGGSMAVRYAF